MPENSPKSLTDEAKAAYLVNSDHCPYCGSVDITGGAFEYGCGSVWQTITCMDCDRSWDDVYHLVAIDEREAT